MQVVRLSSQWKVSIPPHSRSRDARHDESSLDLRFYGSQSVDDAALPDFVIRCEWSGRQPQPSLSQVSGKRFWTACFQHVGRQRPLAVLAPPGRIRPAELNQEPCSCCRRYCVTVRARLFGEKSSARPERASRVSLPPKSCRRCSRSSR